MHDPAVHLWHCILWGFGRNPELSSRIRHHVHPKWKKTFHWRGFDLNPMHFGSLRDACLRTATCMLCLLYFPLYLQEDPLTGGDQDRWLFPPRDPYTPTLSVSYALPSSRCLQVPILDITSLQHYKMSQDGFSKLRMCQYSICCSVMSRFTFTQMHLWCL